jgi:hypothetical protein
MSIDLAMASSPWLAGIELQHDSAFCLASNLSLQRATAAAAFSRAQPLSHNFWAKMEPFWAEIYFSRLVEFVFFSEFAASPIFSFDVFPNLFRIWDHAN